jgi:4-amino-4-deoxychorismate lyase
MYTLLYNFEFLSQETVSISADDRSFQYGDGLFETLVYTHKGIRFLDIHWKRLTGCLQLLSIENPFSDPSQLQSLAKELAIQNLLSLPLRMRLQVWRKPGGLYTPQQHQASFLLSCRPLDILADEKKQAFFSKQVSLSPSLWSHCKTCNTLPYIIAGIEKEQRQADELILCTPQGHLSECISSNLFWITKGILYTPSLESGCISGIMRSHILSHILSSGIRAKQGLYDKNALFEAEAVFCCNVTGIQKIRYIEGHRVPDDVPLWPDWKEELIQNL